MNDGEHWSKLLIWLSPSFPVGGFAYSGGLEAAAFKELVHDRATLAQWLTMSMANGPLAQDLTLCALSRDEEADGWTDLSTLALALATTPERMGELETMGRSFQIAAKPWWDGYEGAASDLSLAYPVAVGALASHHHIPKRILLQAFLHAAVSTQIQAALRLIPLGQTAGVELMRDLNDTMADTVERAAQANGEGDLATCAFVMDCAALTHATLPSRIFRS